MTLRSPQLYYLYHADESAPLRDMPVIPPADEGRRINEVKLLHPVRPLPPGAGAADPVRQRHVEPPRVAVTPGLSFDGIGVGLGSFTPSVAPPDTNGAPGATQYVQWVNLSFAVFNKANGALVFGPAAGNTLWQNFGPPCQNTNDGDPIATYDKAANRWVLTQFSIENGQFFQCVAVSTTADATGTYRRFAFQFPAFNDYPKLGVWPDGYYMSFNMFNSTGTAFLGSRVCALDRNQMITATGTPGPIQCFQLGSNFGGLLPSDLDGATAPPAGSPNFFLAFGANVLELWKFHVSWSSPATTTFIGPTNLPVAAFSEACGGGTCIPQLGTAQLLDSLADRLMYRLAYRNFGDHESLVVNHSIAAAPAASGARWYEVRNPNGAATVFQQGTFAPDATARWMGSIAMDHVGNIALGYSASSTSLAPGVRFTGRTSSDPLGTMQTENTVIGGVGVQIGGLSRWGDYSAMTIDPVDDCTFWYTTEYLKATGSFNWSTRIASFKFPSCGGGGGGPYSTFLLQTGTPITQPDAAANFVFAVGDFNRDGIPDVFAFKKTNTGTGRLEVHVLNGATNYQSFLLQIGTPIASADAAANFSFAVGDFNGDGIPDVFALKKTNTGTGRLEVHVLNGATNYQSFLLQIGTPITSADAAANFSFAVGDFNRDGRADVYGFKTTNTGTGRLEVHVLNGAANYQSFLLQTGTPITAPDAAANFSFAVGDANRDGIPDVVGFKTTNTGTGRLEIHVLNGASNYQSFVLQTGTAISAADAAANFTFAVGDLNRDAFLDVFGFKKTNTGTGRLEVHVLNGVP
jgi:hypothetical protein